MVSEGRMVGAGRSPGLGRRVSRRGVLGLVGRLGLGVGGAAAVAGLPLATFKRVNAADDGSASDGAFAVIADERPVSPESVEVRYWTDHLSGPRVATLQWGLSRFQNLNPRIQFRIEEATPQLRMSAAWRRPVPEAHVVLLSQAEFLRYRETGAFLRVNDLLPKLRSARRIEEYHAPETFSVRPGQFDLLAFEQHYFVPDTFTDDKLDHSFPQPAVPDNPRYRDQYGLPFELTISGFLANIALAEKAGVRLPDSVDSWTWDDWTEWDARMTDPETGVFGTWARDDYAGQYMPQMYTNGLKKPFNDALTKTMFDRPEAMDAWSYLIEKVVDHRTSPAAGEAEELAGEYETPFDAGKIGIWPTDGVSATGVHIPRIRDRFAWTLLPAVVGPGGGPPGHSWSMRGNLVSAIAEAEGNAEEVVEFIQFLAGPEYQRRVGIERGHVPVHKSAMEEPESFAQPPHGVKWLKVYADRPDNRSPYPFVGWERWWDGHRTLARKGWTGELTPAQALEACQAWGERFLRVNYTGRTPNVREPVYP